MSRKRRRGNNGSVIAALEDIKENVTDPIMRSGINYIRRKFSSGGKRGVRRSLRTRMRGRSGFGLKNGPLLYRSKPHYSRRKRYRIKRKLLKILKHRHKKTVRRDFGMVTASDVNQSQWSVFNAGKYDDIVTDLGSLTTYTNDAAGPGRQVNTTLKDDPNFRCYIETMFKLRIRNNQSDQEGTGLTLKGKSTIYVNAYLIIPKYGVGVGTDVLTLLKNAFAENGGTATTTNRTQYMIHAPKFRKFFKVISFGRHSLQPGDAREFKWTHPKKWWTRFEEAQTENIEQKWEAFFLIRQQGQMFQNSLVSLDATKPAIIGSRLTCMGTEYRNYYYKQIPDPIKTRTVLESNIDTDLESTVGGLQAQAVNDDNPGDIPYADYAW